MTFNESIQYHDNLLYIDAVPVPTIVQAVQTPTYVYSLPRTLANYQRIQQAFREYNAHIHYSAKANANLAVLRALMAEGAGVDCVSGGEIYRALHAGASPQKIVFAGVGKTPQELRYALENAVGWINIENEGELVHIQRLAAEMKIERVRVALRLNPEVTANTHPYIATGHGGAKFGLTATTIERLLAAQDEYSRISIEGLHVHIGSQLGDTEATVAAVETAKSLAAPYPQIRTLNIGGGMPTDYGTDDYLPTIEAFAQALQPLLADYEVILEPGRSIIADAGVLLTRVLYIKQQAGQRIVIVDASMTELMRPALYDAVHQIVPVRCHTSDNAPAQVVGPVCETTDVLARDVSLPDDLDVGDTLAILTTGAYGFVMANTYNQRPRPAEVIVDATGQGWQTVRQRETYADLLRGE